MSAYPSFAPGVLIQPSGHPEFAGYTLYKDNEDYIVRGAFACHDHQSAWKFAIPIHLAVSYTGQQLSVLDRRVGV